MNLTDLRPADGSTHRRKRIGRGPGSGHGKTSTRGHKGDKARGSVRPGFEGGQTPLHRRLPKQRGIGVGLTARGFNTGRYKTHYSAVNLDMIALRFEAGSEVSPEALQAVGLISSLALPVKILSRGGVDKVLTVRAHKFSAGAQVAITAAGGTVEVI